MASKSKKKGKHQRGAAAAAARKRAAEHSSGFDRTSLNVPEGVNVLSIKSEGTKRVDIIPFISNGNKYCDEGSEYSETTYFTHRKIGVNEDTFVCPRATAEYRGDKPTRCPICDYVQKLRKEEGDEKLIKDLIPKQRQLFNVIDLSNKDKGIQIWDISYHLFGKQLDARLKNQDEDDRYDEFSELEGGKTLKLGIEEKNQGGYKFFEVETIDFKPRKTDYKVSMLKKASQLEDVVKILSYDELKDIFLGTGGISDDDDQEDDADDDDQEDDQDDDADDDDTEEDNIEEDDTEEDDEDIPFDIDDRVSAEVDGEMYEGTVTGIVKGKVEIEFDDGDEGSYTPEEVTPIKSKKGKGKKKGKKKYPLAASKSKKSGNKNTKSKKDNGKKGKKEKCPNGGVFGKDCDKLEECDNCDKWDECDDAKNSK